MAIAVARRPPEMTLEEIDRELQRLGGAAERVGANLLEVELDHSRRLLDESELRGESARRWAAASATLLQLWEWHGLLVALLERAVKLRGIRARVRADLGAEVAQLIRGASMELFSRDVPLAQRNAMGNPQATVRLSPDQLLQRMSAGFDEANAVLAQIGSAWEAFGPRLRRARALVGETSELCRSVGERDPRELDRAHERLTELTEALAKDPLSVRRGDIDALETSVAALRGDLVELAKLKGEIGDRLLGARELLEELCLAQRKGEAAHAEVLVKIAAPTVPAPVALAGIEVELDQVVELSKAGGWRRAREALGQWTARASSLLEQAHRTAADNRAQIETRDQLRGRLKAYQAKAKQLGLIEDPELDGIFARAQATLYTAPTDLAHAEALVRLYQRALPGSPPAGEDPK